MILKTGKKISESALTLIEVLIVLSIMGLFLIFSVPLFTRFSESTQLDATARNISSALTTARGYAITKNADHYVCFDITSRPAPDTYFISDDGTNVIAGEKINRLPTGITFANMNFTEGSGDDARFKPTGMLYESVPNPNTSIDVQDASDSRTITVERTTGRVRIN